MPDDISCITSEKNSVSLTHSYQGEESQSNYQRKGVTQYHRSEIGLYLIHCCYVIYNTALSLTKITLYTAAIREEKCT